VFAPTNLSNNKIRDSIGDFRLPPDCKRCIVRVNSSEDRVVQSSGLPTGPFTGPEGQDPFWTIDIFRWDLFGSGVGVDITVTPELPETSDPDVVPFTSSYYFRGTDAPSNIHILTIPLQMVHYTMVPEITSPHTRIIAAIQAPIGTPLSPRFTPMLPPGYHALNASIPTPTQTSSRTPTVSTPFGHHIVPGFIPTLHRPLFRGPLPSSIGGTNSSGTISSFTPNYQISVGGQFHQGGQTQSPFAGQIPIGTQPLIRGKLPLNPPYGQNIPPSLAQYWNYLIQHNPHSTEGKQPQASSVIPPSTSQPYLGTSNPIWGSNAQPHAPIQGYNPMNYLPPHQQLNLPSSLHYMQTAYGPTSLLMGLPPQSHQYPHMNR
jgi:hypothetical protein